jgi:flagellar basal-body rod protein FlgB
MFFDELLNRGVTPALTATLSYTESRHKMIAENVANIDTPGYKAKQLDVRAFQKALGEALDRRTNDSLQPLVLEGREFRSDPTGALRVTPSLTPTDNVLFHDGTNLSLEREMADLAENSMTHQLTATLLGRKFDMLRKAIRGKL